jgi:3-hydroxyisobutyrate dehydrogenase-like beta-hydroxyacid dehydrogenase
LNLFFVNRRVGLLKIAVFGLGEAGSLIARDLAYAGVQVMAYDPADVVTPDGVRRVHHPGEAVVDVDMTAQQD